MVLLTARVVAVMRFGLLGSPSPSADQVVAGLRRLRDVGVVYVLLIVENDRAQLRRFHDEVMPCLAD